MRRKTYDVLFEPEAGMLALVKTPCLWRRAFYFIGKFNEVSGNAKKIPLYRFCPQQGNSLHLTVSCEL